MTAQQKVERCVKEAAAVLKNAGLPSTPEELLSKSVNPKDRLVLNAILIITNAHYMRQETEKNRTDRALNRLHSVFSAYDEFFILKNVAGYKNGVLLTNEVIRDTQIGINSRNIIKEAREKKDGTINQRKKLYKLYQKTIDDIYRKNTTLSYTALSINAAKKLEKDGIKVSDKTIRNHTKDPTEQNKKAT